jgi:hypothetical protein
MEYYSATKKNEIMSFTGKWLELENTAHFLLHKNLNLKSNKEIGKKDMNIFKGRLFGE